MGGTDCIVKNCPNRDKSKCPCIVYRKSGTATYMTREEYERQLQDLEIAINLLKAQGYIVISPEEAQQRAEECHKKGIEFINNITGMR